MLSNSIFVLFFVCDIKKKYSFQALGNFYFIHESITDALLYDFEQRQFLEVNGKEIYSENIESVRTKEKSKFPLEYFPEVRIFFLSNLVSDFSEKRSNFTYIFSILYL